MEDTDCECVICMCVVSRTMRWKTQTASVSSVCVGSLGR